MNGISRETFAEMEVSSKLNILFDYVKDNHRCSCETTEKLTALERKVDRRRKFDTSVAGITGFVGGILAHLGESVLRGK